MRKSACVILLAILLGMSFPLRAQDLQYGYFQMNHQYLLNPAQVVNDQEQIFLEYGRKWSDLAFPPEVFQIGGVFHNSQKLSFGGIVNKNSSGVLDRYHFGISTGYKVQLAGNQTLAGGIVTYLKNNNIMLDNVIGDLNDPVLTGGEYNKTLFGVGIGLSYSYDRLNVHVSLPETHDKDNRMTFFSGGASYNFQVNDFLIIPSTTYFGTSVDKVVEGMVMASWKNTLSAGAGYRTDNTFGIRLEFQSGPISLGYALANSNGTFTGVGISNNFSVRYIFRPKSDETGSRLSSIEATNDRILSRLEAQQDSTQRTQQEILTRLDALSNEQNEVKTLQRDVLERYEEADRKNTVDESTNEEVEPGYYLVIYSFHDSTEIKKIKEEMVSLPFESLLIHDKDKSYYYVSTRRYETLEMAVIGMEKVHSQGYEEAWIHWYK